MKYPNLLKAGVAPLALGLALVAAPAFAQDAAVDCAANPEDPSCDAPSGTPIVVTGSRIASPTINSVAPLQVVDDKAIDDTGASNLQQVLLENPAFGTPALSRTNSAFLTSGTGIATVDLRDLGSDRTLVLINGRRVVAGQPGTATVDLNTIPTQFLRRVDVLTGGASSLYGSDAVAGVVNLIYKDDFQGVEANGQYNITERGDTPEYQANITFGGNFADDRGNMMVHFGYVNQGGLRSRDRANTRIDDLDTFWNFTGEPADYGVPSEPFFSSFPPQGRFLVGQRFNGDGLATGPLYTFTYGPTGLLQPCFQGNASAACNSARPAIADNPATTVNEASPAVPGIGTGVGPNGFNRQNFRTLAVPVERRLFAMRGHYDISDAVRLFGEATYANTSSSREIEPFPLDSGGNNGIFPAAGRVPIETRVPVAGAPGTFTIVRNPFVPDAIFNVANDADGDGLRDIGFVRRLSEFGTRNGSVNRDFFRAVLGFEGDIFDGWRWDASYNYGRVTEQQRSNGQVNVANFRNALSAIPGPNGPICADPIAQAQGCVPINVFGFNSISPQAVRYVAAEQTLQSKITQQVLQANLTGSLFELPAGPLGIAIGAEYRKETSAEDNDALTNAGLNAGNALGDTFGEFDVKEAYGEVAVPILADTPGFHALNLRAAGRVSNYSTVGTVYSYSLGAEWSPFQELSFKGTYARSVRAPNIGELFTGPSQTFPTGLIDPCVGVTATSTGTASTICRSQPGVNANIAANGGTFTLNQADIQGISGFNFGNPNLQEEKSTSWTASATWAPRSIDFLRNLVLRVDYYNISVEDSVVSLPRAFILNQCYTQGDQDFCRFVTRRPTVEGSNSAGSIDLIDSNSVNGGELKAEGIDVNLTNRFPLDGLGLGGSLVTRIAYTHLLDGFVIPQAGADKDFFAGEIGTAGDRFNAFVGYASERFDWGFTGNFISASCEDDQSLAGPSYQLEPCSVQVGDEFYLDTQLTYKPGDNLEFYFGVDNLLDNAAPNILSGSPFNVTGSDTAADVYDVFGRRYYAGVRIKM